MSVLDEQEESADVMMMRMALHVAHRGRPSPNPHVGAVLTRDGELVATGYHRAAGQAHAEVDALAKLQGDARGTTLYVTLEPCDHQGRTGPCSQVLIDAGVSRVVIGCLDPVPAHGGGAARLREAGVSGWAGGGRRMGREGAAGSGGRQAGRWWAAGRGEAAGRELWACGRNGMVMHGR